MKIVKKKIVSFILDFYIVDESFLFRGLAQGCEWRTNALYLFGKVI